jgi:YjbE family integral membrane protein
VDALFTSEFLSALLAIVVIDLVLAGDNAIVIALAARNLPPDLQKRAIIWGTMGAIIVRSLMTVAVVWLLKIPGLMLAGGALLIWIAYKLLTDDGGDESEHGAGATTFFGAMKTIVIADAVMGLDNVLAVAGAAQGSYLLVVLGLLISIPIVIWGSTLILKWVERYPAIVYVGAGVLAWTAVKMMTSEPLVKPVLEQHGWITPLAYAVVVGGVLGGGWLAQRRRKLASATAATSVTPRH